MASNITYRSHIEVLYPGCDRASKYSLRAHPEPDEWIVQYGPRKTQFLVRKDGEIRNIGSRLSWVVPYALLLDADDSVIAYAAQFNMWTDGAIWLDKDDLHSAYPGAGPHAYENVLLREPEMGIRLWPLSAEEAWSLTKELRSEKLLNMWPMPHITVVRRQVQYAVTIRDSLPDIALPRYPELMKELGFEGDGIQMRRTHKKQSVSPRKPQS